MVPALILTALLTVLHIDVGSSARHDIHISYCSATLGDRSLNGKVSYYLDDFYRAVTEWNGTDVRRLPQGEFQALARQYLSQTFRATANGSQHLPMTIASMGVDGSNIWFQFNFNSSSRIVSLLVDHRALFKQFNDQMNLLLVKVSGDDQNFVLNSSNPSAHISR